MMSSCHQILSHDFSLVFFGCVNVNDFNCGPIIRELYNFYTDKFSSTFLILKC